MFLVDPLYLSASDEGWVERCECLALPSTHVAHQALKQRGEKLDKFASKGRSPFVYSTSSHNTITLSYGFYDQANTYLTIHKGRKSRS